MGLDIPVWGQYSITGILVGIIAFVVVSIIRGDLVTRKTLEQEQHRGDKWQEAYEKSQEVMTTKDAVWLEIGPLTATLKKFLQALPRVPSPPAQEDDDVA